MALSCWFIPQTRGCSIDPVHEDRRFRYAQARGIGENIARDAAAWICARIDSSLAGKGETVAVSVNPGPARNAALLSFHAAELPPNPALVDREGRSYPLQLLSDEGRSAVFFDERSTPRQLRFAMGMVKKGRLLELGVQSERASWQTASILRIDLELAQNGFSPFDWDA